MSIDRTTFKMNGDHGEGCPCNQCFKVGDKVLVYLNDGEFSEEIVTVIAYVRHNRGTEHPIGVKWPSRSNGPIEWWLICADPKATKEEYRGGGKLIRKATKADILLHEKK